MSIHWQMVMAVEMVVSPDEDELLEFHLSQRSEVYADSLTVLWISGLGPLTP